MAFLGSRVTGFDFIRAVRQQRGIWSTPVVVLSGYVRERDRDGALSAGGDRFLLKPCLPD
jgi:CheY-like chemotaxis protein